MPHPLRVTTHCCRTQPSSIFDPIVLDLATRHTNSLHCTAMSRLFLLSIFLALSLTFTLSVAQPEMPSPPDMYDNTIFEIAQVGATSFGLGYGGGGKGAFPVGAFGANVGLPAVPAVPLAIASGGGKHGGGGYGGGGGGHGKKGRGGPRLGFLIAAPVPVAQPYGGQLHQDTYHTADTVAALLALYEIVS